MQYIQVDTNFRSTRKFESQFLDLPNYFYPFLNLAGICKKGKIKSLKKRRMGRGGGREPGQPRSAGLPGPGTVEAVHRCLIQIGWRASLLLHVMTHACDGVGAS
jgi:hypothetical protein